MSGGGKSGSTTVGYRYYMSLHQGVCRGPVDELVQINVGDVRAWPVPDGDPEKESGVTTIAQGPGNTGVKQMENGTASSVPAAQILTAAGPVNKDIRINAPKLFGGDKKEGGIDGTLRLFFGSKTQTIPAAVRNLMGGLVPAFRGPFTVFYDGLLCSLNPYPKAWKFRVRRVLQGWDGDVWHPELAVIWLRSNMLKAMNPAHIIYECLTNRDWGRGFPRTAINDASFLASAQKLFDEGMGLCMIWDRQDELGSFVQNVIDHIGGSLYPDPTTGLITLDLLRGDYDAAAIPVFGYDTGLIEISEDETATRDDLVNEVIVTYHDPLKDEDRQVRLHNLASFQSLKALKSTTTPYTGFPTSDLASRTGQRDLKTNSTALKRYKVTLDRRAWKIRPGSVFRINAADKNIANIVLRAGKIGKGNIQEGRIQVEAVIDVFGLAATSFVSEQPGAWEPPDRTAIVPAQRYVREATYADLVTRLSTADLDYVDVLSGAISTMVGKPSSGSQNYNVAAKTTAETEYLGTGAGTFAQTAVLASAIGIYDTVVPFTQGIDLALIEIGEPIQIGTEIARLDAITLNEDEVSGTFTIARGCTDTLPQAHPVGRVLYFFGSDLGTDAREYAMSETVQVKVLTNTSTQQLTPDLAPTDVVAITARQGRPWPPGNMRVNGEPFGTVTPQSSFDDIELTWAHRNRKTIQDILVAHGDTGSMAEEGTTYTIRVFSSFTDTDPQRVVTGIADNEWIYTTGQMDFDGAGSTPVFEIEAVRDGQTSQFKYRFMVQRT